MRQTADAQIEAVLRIARAVAVRQGAPVHAADDIAQEVVVVYLTGETRPAKNWEAWVTTVAKNRTIDYWRRHERVEPGLERPEGHDSDAYREGRIGFVTSKAATEQALLDQVLGSLSERDRTMLVLDAAGLSNAQIANRVGLASAGTAAVTLSRIKKRLRAQHPDLVGDVEHPRVY